MAAPEITETFTPKSRKAWRSWLEKNHDKKKEIWVIYFKKHTKKASVPYDDAVEEGICFGWIDSTVRRIDDERYAQRYTPRRPDSLWSDLNLARAEKMKKADLMTKAGESRLPKPGEKNRLVRNRPPLDHTFPQELKDALAGNPKAKKNWDKFPPSSVKQYCAWINNAKQPETRKRRIKRAVERAEENLKDVM